MPGLWQCRDGIDGAPTLQGTGARGPGTPRGRRCSLTSTSKAKSPRPRQTSSRLLPNLGQNSGLKHPSFQPAFVSLKTFTSKNFRFREKLQKVPRVPVSLSPSLPSSSRTSGPPPSGDEDPAPHPPPSSQIGDEDPPPHPSGAHVSEAGLHHGPVHVAGGQAGRGSGDRVSVGGFLLLFFLHRNGTSVRG